MKIDIDFDELLNHALNSAISATVNLSDKNSDAAGQAEQFERIAKISAGVTIEILRAYHEQLAFSLEKLLTTH